MKRLKVGDIVRLSEYCYREQVNKDYIEEFRVFANANRNRPFTITEIESESLYRISKGSKEYSQHIDGWWMDEYEIELVPLQIPNSLFTID